jgi:hypothetical protein
MHIRYKYNSLEEFLNDNGYTIEDFGEAIKTRGNLSSEYIQMKLREKGVLIDGCILHEETISGRHRKKKFKLSDMFNICITWSRVDVPSGARVSWSKLNWDFDKYIRYHRVTELRLYNQSLTLKGDIAANVGAINAKEESLECL